MPQACDRIVTVHTPGSAAWGDGVALPRSSVPDRAICGVRNASRSGRNDQALYAVDATAVATSPATTATIIAVAWLRRRPDRHRMNGVQRERRRCVDTAREEGQHVHDTIPCAPWRQSQ